jgi:hypothetical protein
MGAAVTPGSKGAAARKPPVFGPEPWGELAGATWFHWDLWFCLVCLVDFDGEWRALEEAIVASRRRSYGSLDWEAKDSHLHDLEARLERAGVSAEAVAGGHLGDKVVLRKARLKVLKQSLASRDLTSAMRYTPRQRLLTRALRGHWDRFPVSPERDWDVLATVIEAARSDGRGSFGVAMDFEDAVNELDAERADRPEHRLALWRAAVTAGMETFEQGIRDSDGAIATYTGQTLVGYAGLSWQGMGMEAAEYYQDLCEVCVWDHWGLLYERETAPFRKVRKVDLPLVEEILWALEAEHRANHLDFQADEAGQHVAWLHVATRAFDGMAAVAQRLGSDHWKPITAMAEAAVEADRVGLAVDIFSAATSRPGPHQELLSQKCEALTGTPLVRRRHLRAVE